MSARSASETGFGITLRTSTGLETVRAGVLQEVVYSVVIKKSSNPKVLLEAIRTRNDNNKVTLVVGQQEIDV